MIIVTGTYRSGTSVAMQTYASAGVPVYGDQFPSWVRPLIKAKEPLGHYECAETSAGIRRELGNNVAVKIVLNALINLSSIPDGTRIIVCDRNWLTLAASQKDFDEVIAPWQIASPPLNWTIAKQTVVNQALYSAFGAWVVGKNITVTRLPFENWATSPATNRQILLSAVQ